MVCELKASERRHARSASNTIQADRRGVVLAVRTHYGHLVEMRQVIFLPVHKM